MAAGREATTDDLYHVEGKAEIVNGELVLIPLSSGLHGFACMGISASLLSYARQTKRGHAFGDSVGFIVNLPNRRSFGPDAAFCTQPLTDRFVDGAPLFAVEVRSRDEYGPVAERMMAAKRADYFAAGTKVVWDVDTLREQVVRVYSANRPETPMVCRRAERADAGPALPGWSMPVDDLFPA